MLDRRDTYTAHHFMERLKSTFMVQMTPAEPITMQQLPTNKINHVTLVLDRSSSMLGREKDVVKVTDGLVKFLAERSKDMDQETRVTVYLFNDSVQCLIYDKDVLRMPSAEGLYRPSGMTNLVGATIQAIGESTEIPQKYGDHAFLFYVVTDGENNINDHLADKLERLISGAQENYTVACLVPDSIGARQAARFGFPNGNIQQWDTRQSFEEVGNVIHRTTEAYFQARASGVRGTRSLFSMDTSKLNTRNVQRKLLALQSRDYDIFTIKRDSPIRDFVEFYTKKPYVMGSSYYQLTKPEAVQNYKQVALRKVTTGAIYAGREARELLGLPDYEVKVLPTAHPDYDIFIQSTSTNRKLIKGTEVLVLRNP